MGTTPVVSNGTPAGSYNLTVTGTTSGGLQHTTMSVGTHGLPEPPAPRESEWTARRRERLGVTPNAIMRQMQNPHPSKTGSGGAPSRADVTRNI